MELYAVKSLPRLVIASTPRPEQTVRLELECHHTIYKDEGQDYVGRHLHCWECAREVQLDFSTKLDQPHLRVSVSQKTKHVYITMMCPDCYKHVRLGKIGDDWEMFCGNCGHHDIYDLGEDPQPCTCKFCEYALKAPHTRKNRLARGGSS